MPYSARKFFWLTFFFGGLGVGQFYVGRAGRGIMYLLTLGGFVGILPLVDLFRSRKVTERENGRVLELALSSAA